MRADYVHTLARLHQPPPVHILRSLCPVCLGANIEICTVGTDGRDLGNLWVDAGADDAMNEAEPGVAAFVHTLARLHHPPPVHILRSMCPVCLGANLEICTVGMDGRDLGTVCSDLGAEDAMNEVESGALGYSCTRHHPSTTLHECIFRNPCALRV